jgi:hypothetical protein
MSRRIVSTLALASVAVLAACSGDVTSPTSNIRSITPSALLSPDEGVRIISDSVDASGNTILVQEFGMGSYTLPTGEYGTVASVTIKSILPGTVTSSKTCLTHSIVATDAMPDVRLSIRKSGGCNKDIEILIEQTSTGKKAIFKFSMVPGKTVIDSGLLR